MTKVFMLYHIRNEDSDDEDIKLIGIYTSYELAKSAQMRVQDKPGFIDYPDGFSIIENPLDCDGWVDGFVDL
ncbi:hypothetical protein [Budvicia aquatica]|uniref:DUF7336 domain-containing protein n=1 Tax=Budvicia aquatica TaxID=82979 RepID=A0A2C6DR33_9GAMM|nr:hypothetical protein [Budvicia aquatica]PHI30905.1 hypothetical protein CRN84_16950 [Budvicia aquatica]VFS50813.1 Uncharacterised protein [Budvicia aquatica]